MTTWLYDATETIIRDEWLRDGLKYSRDVRADTITRRIGPRPQRRYRSDDSPGDSHDNDPMWAKCLRDDMWWRQNLSPDRRLLSPLFAHAVETSLPSVRLTDKPWGHIRHKLSLQTVSFVTLVTQFALQHSQIHSTRDAFPTCTFIHWKTTLL